MKILKVDNLSKSIEKKKILKNISFSVDEGEIVGFVGPNGAGKTTTMKTITNLIFPDEGDIHICGHDLFKEREKALTNISAVVETPGLYTYLSGRDNLNIIRKLNKISKEKLDEIIDFVDLSKRIDDKVKKYSQGMKQRLGLAMCLLSEPKLIILDEPTNGLDPSGTIELRDMLTKLSRDKQVSIFISSHILSEIEKICDKIIYIKDGKVVTTKSYDKNSKNQIIKMNINHANKISEILEGLEFIEDYTIDNNQLTISLDIDNLSKLLTQLSKNNIEYTGFEILNSKVEKEYSEIYGGKN